MLPQHGQGAGKPLLANAEVTLGEYGHTSGTVGLRGEQNGFDYQVNLSRVTEHGISATNAKDVFSYHPDRDGLQQTAAQVALGYALNADWRIEGQWLQSQGKAWVDDGPSTQNPYADMRTEVGRLALKGKLLPIWTTTVSIGESTDKLVNRQAAWGDSHLNTRQTEFKSGQPAGHPRGHGAGRVGAPGAKGGHLEQLRGQSAHGQCRFCRREWQRRSPLFAGQCAPGR